MHCRDWAGRKKERSTGRGGSTGDGNHDHTRPCAFITVRRPSSDGVCSKQNKPTSCTVSNNNNKQGHCNQPCQSTHRSKAAADCNRAS